MRISGQHFGIKFIQNRCIICDLSSNGTFISTNGGVTGQRIGKNKTSEVKIGDRIRILKPNDFDQTQHIYFTVEKFGAD